VPGSGIPFGCVPAPRARPSGDHGVHREQIRRSRDEFAIPPEAVARVIAFAIEQPYDVEVGDITIRPTVQG
jgi:NADP-dependent 3-hydroxy acid dehydrogenase YdfG